ncbi:PaaI family thioesterase [Desulfobotulus mexicanus]|uniref:PaaI family thioesterase n=1 Tax=Desulfobotulus mexicanus TaxID=2586642 RepID=UPI0015D1B22D|nr:PaaI family thioesterase [Desulfobotulus mexicanus]
MQEKFNSHEGILRKLKSMGQNMGDGFVLPPCFETLNGIFTEYLPGAYLSCRFMHEKGLANPAGSLQGGFLMAAFDNVFGPFSILESGRAAVSLELNGTFLRPLMVEDLSYDIRVSLVEKSARFLVMEAEARDSQMRLAAKAHSRMFFL